MRKFLYLSIIVGCFAASLRAQNPGAAGPWQRLARFPQAHADSDIWVRPDRFSPFQLNQTALREILSRAPIESRQAVASSRAEVTLPMPDGSLARFRFVESPIMAPELAAKFPEIKAYLAQ